MRKWISWFFLIIPYEIVYFHQFFNSNKQHLPMTISHLLLPNESSQKIHDHGHPAAKISQISRDQLPRLRVHRKRLKKVGTRGERVDVYARAALLVSQGRRSGSTPGDSCASAWCTEPSVWCVFLFPALSPKLSTFPGPREEEKILPKTRCHAPTDGSSRYARVF